MKYVSILFLIFGTCIVYSQDGRFLPQGGDYQVIEHGHYILGYSEPHEQAAWVAYELLPSEIYGSVKRTDDFREDPDVTTGSASLDDYKWSGYDRGHLAPAADFSFNGQAMSESFFLSNMSPQEASFNRGAWASLEKQVRNWVSHKGKMYVITGAILDNPKEFIGKNQVAVPKWYFKIVFSFDDNSVIGVVMPNQRVSGFRPYIRTIDEIEELTNLDFFSELDNTREAILESSQPQSSYWGLASSHNTSSYDSEGYPLEDSRSDQKNSGGKMVSSVRCQGWAVSAGRQCKNMTKNENKHCHVHQSQVGESKNYKPSKIKTSSGGRCTATTKAGTRCKRSASAGSSRCWQH